jgi:hypothetical protein
VAKLNFAAGVATGITLGVLPGVGVLVWAYRKLTHDHYGATGQESEPAAPHQLAAV